MTQDTLLNMPAVTAPDARQVERRRPGRTDVAPELIPLLRARIGQDAVTDARDWSVLEDEDGMAPARGIVFGLLLVVPFWAVVGFFVFR